MLATQCGGLGRGAMTVQKGDDSFLDLDLDNGKVFTFECGAHEVRDGRAEMM